MNFFKENKFLTGYLAVVLLGAGALGFLVMQAMGTYSDAVGAWESESAELSRLQKLPSFPNDRNVSAMDRMRKKHAGVVADLQKELVKTEIPLEPMTPEQFQDKLRAAVTDTVARAEAIGMKLPGEGKFYMGFDPYENAPPRVEAAAPLGRQLLAIQLLMDTLIGNKVVELRELKRPELLEEGGSAPVEATPAPGAKGRIEKSGPPLLQTFPVQTTFLVEQNNFRSILNTLISSKTQFFIPRVLTVKNENPRPPSRIVVGAPTVAQGYTPPPPLDPNMPQPMAGTAVQGVPAVPARPALAMKYIVGEERVEVGMRLEQVDFADPAPVK